MRRIELSECTIDVVARTAVRAEGPCASLTEQEVALLVYLAHRAGEVVTRAELLEQVLGYSPLSKTRAVDHALARLRTKIERDAPAIISVHGVGYRLVTRGPSVHGGPDRFVGRAEEREVLARWLAESRAVTLLGPGGIGKSRLATEVLAQHAERWPGGIAVVSARRSRSVDDLALDLLRVLDIPHVQRDPAGRLGRVLALRGRTLCRFDDAEMAPAVVRTLVARLLSAAPDLTVLATSRVRLELDHEVVLPVGPLSLADSASLLAARATEADVRSALDPEQIARCVTGLDGVPLAIELAAARLRVMPIEVVAARLDEILGSAPVKRAVTGTLSSLPAEARSAWIRLGVFAGAFSAAAAGYVLGPAPGALDRVALLADYGLLYVEPGGRLRMLAPIRTAAQEAGTDPVAARHHAEWFAQWGDPERIEALHGPAGRRLRSELARESDDLVAAAEWALGAEDIGLATRCLVGVAELFMVTSGLEVLAPLLERALSRAGRAERGRLLRIAAHRQLAAGESALAEAALRRAAADLESEGASWAGWTSARVWSDLGVILARAGRGSEAEAAFQTALARARTVRARRLEAVTRGNYAFALHDRGKLREAHGELSIAIAGLEHAGDQRMLAGFLGNLALVCRDLGEVDRARELFTRALAAHTEMGDLAVAGIVGANLSALERGAGHLSDARRHAERAWALVRPLALPRVEGYVLSARAAVHHAAGLYSEAFGDYTLAVDALSMAGDRVSAARARSLCARSMAALGHPRADLALDESCAELEETGQQSALATALAWRGERARARGDLATARADLDRAVELLGNEPLPACLAEIRAWRACLEASAGDPVAAEREIAAAVALSEGIPADSDAKAAIAAARRIVSG